MPKKKNETQQIEPIEYYDKLLAKSKVNRETREKPKQQTEATLEVPILTDEEIIAFTLKLDTVGWTVLDRCGRDIYQAKENRTISIKIQNDLFRKAADYLKIDVAYFRQLFDYWTKHSYHPKREILESVCEPKSPHIEALRETYEYLSDDYFAYIKKRDTIYEDNDNLG